MKIKKLKYGDVFIYPATITSAVKDFKFTKEGNVPMTQQEINSFLNNSIPTKVSELTNDSGYQKTTEADNKYMSKSGGSGSFTSSLSISNNGSFNNYGNNGQAFNAVRDLTGTTKYLGEAGSGYVLNAASFGVKDNGTTAFTHKKYDSFNPSTGAYTNAKNTAVLMFSGKSGLLYAKNTGTAADVTDAMYKYIGVIDSPDEKQKVYSATQVDTMITKIKTVLSALGATEEQLNSITI